MCGDTPDTGNTPTTDSNYHDLNQQQVILYGSGQAKDKTTKAVRKLTVAVLQEVLS